MGGGGGAGHQNNSAGGAGGNGGGIVLLIASTITGTGSISANGANGGDTQGTGNDAPGGGGAGGTIVAYATSSLSGIAFTANGGDGGNQSISQAAHGNEAEGPGGGGGGGYIATANGVGSSQSANGGANGITNSVALTEFPANGATSGATGEINQIVTVLPVPVELVTFRAHLKDDLVQLHWCTATELNNFGFEIERREDGGAWERIGFVPGQGTTASPKEYSYVDILSPALRSGSVLSYRLRQVDRDGSFDHSPVVEIRYGAQPLSMTLLPPYPSPAHDVIVLPFSLEHARRLSIRIFDILGNEVLIVRNGEVFQEGVHALGVRLDALPNGHYFVEIRSDSERGVQPVRVMR
ncbi:MAG: T9SS type A sorting domain-containing protein [Bacteroidetes bacterium]|nr:T9SS type A sorting domain-containing protein [Bacteroidota bacterium]